MLIYYNMPQYKLNTNLNTKKGGKIMDLHIREQ